MQNNATRRTPRGGVRGRNRHCKRSGQRLLADPVFCQKRRESHDRINVVLRIGILFGCESWPMSNRSADRNPSRQQNRSTGRLTQLSLLDWVLQKCRKCVATVNSRINVLIVHGQSAKLVPNGERRERAACQHLEGDILKAMAELLGRKPCSFRECLELRGVRKIAWLQPNHVATGTFIVFIIDVH